MIIMDVKLNHVYGFDDFHMNFTYPRKLAVDIIGDETLEGRERFRYKKAVILMGTNATGKTSLGRALLKIFSSVKEANEAILRELKAFNERPFQKKSGSRYSVYMEEELPFMQPLPEYPYEFASWKVATVQLNYHVSFDKQYYSVPYAYARKKVDIRSTERLIEIYYQGNRICSHRRLYGRMGQYSTNTDHMPKNHRLYGEWNADRFLRWAGDIGPSTKEVVEKIFASYRVEEQAYKGCLSLLKLADKYSSDRLENACRVALVHIPSPRYKNIRLILEAGQDLPKKSEPKQDDPSSINRFTHLRGASYYGGGRHES